MPGGVKAMQRSAVRGMLAALEPKEPPADLLRYAIANLAKHVAEARQDDGEDEEGDGDGGGGGGSGDGVLRDELLSQAMLHHPNDDVRTRVGRGLGLDHIRAAAVKREAAVRPTKTQPPSSPPARREAKGRSAEPEPRQRSRS